MISTFRFRPSRKRRENQQRKVAFVKKWNIETCLGMVNLPPPPRFLSVLMLSNLPFHPLFLSWSTVERSDFRAKKLDTHHIVPNCFRIPIPNFPFWSCFFQTSQYFNIYPVWSNRKKIILNIFKACQGEMFSVVFKR